MRKKTLFWIVGVIILLTILGSFLPEENNKESISTGSVIENTSEEISEESEDNLFNVTYIVDGDTIEIETGERVRLICIDTPEKGEENYKEAREYLEDLILNKKVKLEKDISEADKYNRLLRYIYLEDGTFVNELVVREGYAKAYLYSPDTTLCSIIQDGENYAKIHKLGIWGDKEEEEEIEDYQKKEIFLGNYDCSSNVYNCDDFSTHEEAQLVFEYCGGIGNDIHRLDGDEDGIACESLS